MVCVFFFFFSSRRRHTRFDCDWSSDVCSSDLLFRDPTVDGLKTGHTAAAGYCLVATAKRDLPNVGSHRLISIVLGAASENARANESQKLLNWGYEIGRASCRERV